MQVPLASFRPMSKRTRKQKAETRLAHAGREPARHHGFVNTPIYRGSTVLFPTLASLEANAQDFTYGRLGTPTVKALEEAIAELEGGHAHPAHAVGPVGHRRHAARVRLGRRRGARLRQRLSADAPLLRSRAEAARRGDHLLRPADRRRDQGPAQRTDQGRVRRVRPARRPSRCRTFRRSRKPRTTPAPWW